VALKCADLGHTCASPPVHRRWVAGLQEEFFAQGDRERAAGLPISPLMDRAKAGIIKSQATFFEVVVLPIYRELARALPGAKPMLEAARVNYVSWQLGKGFGERRSANNLTAGAPQAEAAGGVGSL
jgi:hypothetical protein